MEQQIFSIIKCHECKKSPYEIKGILRHYNYRSDPKLVPGIVAIIRIQCSCHACTTILYISWDSKIKKSVNHPRYGRLYTCKYFQIIGCHNNWIIMIFLMMIQMKNITNTLIELLLMVI